MAPTSVSNKGKAKPGSKPPHAPRSRNTTPLPGVRASVEPSSSTAAAEPSYFGRPLSTFLRRCDATVEEILDRSGSSAQHIPSGTVLLALRDQIEKTVLKTIEARCTHSEAALRELQTLKRRTPRAGDDRERKHKLKKLNKKHNEDSKHPPAVGAHGVARQDGADLAKDTSSAVSSPISQAPPSAAGTAPADAPSPSDSDVSHQPAPAPAIPQYQTFGPDPSTFDDPTVYHIRDVTPGMSVEERKEIYCVADFPESDLRDRIAGLPPDKDFSNAKPASQVNASVFASYVEPYIRPLTEEDVAFLKERGDRTAPFVMPRRGPRHYKQIWAEEDGAMHIDSDARPSPNIPRGAAEDLDDDTLESDQVSAGPLLARLLATLRPEGRGAQNAPETNGTNGDAMDLDDPLPDSSHHFSNTTPAATQLPDLLQPSWKPNPPAPRTDYATLDERLMLELKHYGLLTDADIDPANSSYDAHFDDEVAQRLRFLQTELRKQSVTNGARKARILELTEERIAQQEYNTIADDLDNQLNAAYLKRNRNIGKGKKAKQRPGGPGGGSHAVGGSGSAAGNAAGTAQPAGLGRLGVGEPIRTLMERRQQWMDTIGPVVNWGKTGVPEKSIFEEGRMRELESREVVGWEPEGEE